MLRTNLSQTIYIPHSSRNQQTKSKLDSVNDAIANGADVHAKIESSDHKLIHIAAAHGQQETIALLLKKGANINEADGGYWTPLDFAIENKRYIEEKWQKRTMIIDINKTL